ncbi:hypothetical protein M0804_013749 [Polistes exclamans]|nr:hypothetical protein M0804_013749 [Polistes exclamans]
MFASTGLAGLPMLDPSSCWVIHLDNSSQSSSIVFITSSFGMLVKNDITSSDTSTKPIELTTGLIVHSFLCIFHNLYSLGVTAL